jgi:hypothetical protein
MHTGVASRLTTAHRAAALGALAALALLLAATLTTTSAAAASGDVAWARIVPGVVTVGSDRVLDVTPGPGGTVYALGVYDEPAHSGWTWVARYAADGRKLWVKKYGEAEGIDANCWAMTVDRAGDLVVAGSRRSPASADADMLVLKYAPSGKRLWARSYGAPGSGADSATAVCTDAGGNVYAGGFVSRTGGAYTAYAIVRWSVSGHRDWVATVESLTPESGDGARAMTIDAQGASYLTGYVHDSASTTACLTIKVSAAGAVAWKQLFGPAAVDNDGLCIVRRGSAVYVAGRASDDDIVSTTFLVKYATGSGAQSWFTWSGLVQDQSAPLALAVAADGSAWVASDVRDASGGVHAVAQRFDAAGNLWWTATDDDPAAQSLFQDVAVDETGRAWAIGQRFDLSGLTSDVLVAAYSPGGVQRWATTWRSAADENAATGCGCLLGTGGLVVGGSSQRVSTADDPVLLSLRR